MSDIQGLLDRAAAQARIGWGGPEGRFAVTRDTAGRLPDSYRVPFTCEKMLRDGDWTCEPTLAQEVQAWIAEHWAPSQEANPPAGCVRSEWPAQFGPRDRLDTPMAARKLILAAMLHGLEAVADVAVRFAQSGLLEVESIYLLKGPSLGKSIALDDHCTLIPYRDVVQFRESLLEAPFPGEIWPPEDAQGVCALRTRGFESLEGKETTRYVGPLVQDGHLEALALLLGVVWGDGYTVFGGRHLVPLITAASLPYWSIGPIGGSFQQATLLPSRLGQTPIKSRPLDTDELRELLEAYARLDDQARNVVNLAMRRLRDSAGRIDVEDRVIDICIALEAMFTDGEWQPELMNTVSGRGSWLFADSVQERDAARQTLKVLYETRRNVVHGNATEPVGLQPDRESAEMLAEAENILRACLKSIVANGIPDDWEPAKDHRSIWREPKRSSSTLPSVKSDSMSWTVAEQKMIDKALEAVWKKEVNRAPSPPSDAESLVIHGVNAEEIERCREQGTPFVVSVPVRLYMAHPRWPKQEDDPVDERTKYYCRRDVERHLRRWQEAAAERKLLQFTLDHEDPNMYLPNSFSMWRRILQPAGL